MRRFRLDTSRSPVVRFLKDHDFACPGCGFNLRGMPTALCPECGRRLAIDEIEELHHPDSLKAQWRTRLWAAFGLTIASLLMWIVMTTQWQTYGVSVNHMDPRVWYWVSLIGPCFAFAFIALWSCARKLTCGNYAALRSPLKMWVWSVAAPWLILIVVVLLARIAAIGI